MPYFPQDETVDMTVERIGAYVFMYSQEYWVSTQELTLKIHLLQLLLYALRCSQIRFAVFPTY